MNSKSENVIGTKWIEIWDGNWEKDEKMRDEMKWWKRGWEIRKKMRWKKWEKEENEMRKLRDEFLSKNHNTDLIKDVWEEGETILLLEEDKLKKGKNERMRKWDQSPKNKDEVEEWDVWKNQ